jgi:hypothetical protein
LRAFRNLDKVFEPVVTNLHLFMAAPFLEGCALSRLRLASGLYYLLLRPFGLALRAQPLI